jgi:hypothetical protein
MGNSLFEYFNAENILILFGNNGKLSKSEDRKMDIIKGLWKCLIKANNRRYNLEIYTQIP